MLDLGYCAIIVVFFIISVLYVSGLEKLRGDDRE